MTHAICQRKKRHGVKKCSCFCWININGLNGSATQKYWVSRWAMLYLTCHFEMYYQVYFRYHLQANEFNTSWKTTEIAQGKPIRHALDNCFFGDPLDFDVLFIQVPQCTQDHHPSHGISRTVSEFIRPALRRPYGPNERKRNQPKSSNGRDHPCKA